MKYLAVPGSDVVDKTRFNDDEIKLYITDGTGTPVYGSMPPFELSNGESKLFIDTIPGGTPQASPITRNYFLRLWLNTERILISETDYVPGKNAYTTTEFHNKYASVKIQVKGDMAPKTMPTLLSKIETNLSANLYTPAGDTDQTFIVGTSSDDNYKPNNYLWYSGKMWRIVALNKTDGTVTSVKIITQNNITNIPRNGSLANGGSGENSTYLNSYMYQWLNEDFYETLRYPTNYLVTDYSWNATEIANTNKPPKTTMVAGNVGSLNLYEYVKSYTNTTNTNGYLNIGYYWYLINPYDSIKAYRVISNGASGSVNYNTDPSGIRPAINLKPNIKIVAGTGSNINPYRLEGDNDQENNLINNRLNTRYSGEYVKFNNENYRIVGTENNLIKLIKENTFSFVKTFGTSHLYSSTGLTSEWGGYLNNTTASGWYGNLSVNEQNMIETGTWYLGMVEGNTISYKKSLCATVNPIASGGTLIKNCEKTTVTVTAKIGLPRLGEMFTSTIIGDGNSCYLITPSNIEYVFLQDNTSLLISSLYYTYYRTKPVFYLKSNVYITSGTGTPSNPFNLAM